MDDLTRFPDTDPTALLRARDGLYASEMLGAAVVGLDFFTWLGQSPAPAGAICASLGLAERPVDVMLTLFSAMGLVENSHGIFCATKKAREFLVRDSPWFLGPYYSSFADRPVCQLLLEILRTDKPSAWANRKGGKPWAQAMEDLAFTREFTRAMDSRGMYLGPALARQLDLGNHHHLLDIGGGSGIYACCIVAAHLAMKATVFEKTPVDGATREWIARRGLSERVGVVAGDMFAGPLTSGCDVHLWSNALHDWDTPTVKALVAKSFAALPPSGMIAIHDAHISREKNGPLSVAAYSVFLMASTEGKCYSLGEMDDILSEAGFEGIELRNTAADHSVITARKPAF